MVEIADYISASISGNRLMLMFSGADLEGRAFVGLCTNRRACLVAYTMSRHQPLVRPSCLQKLSAELGSHSVCGNQTLPTAVCKQDEARKRGLRQSVHAKRLTEAIKTSLSPTEVLNLLFSNSRDLNVIHLTAATTRLASFSTEQWRGEDIAHTHCLLTLLQDKSHHLDARGVANVLWALGRLSQASAMNSIKGQCQLLAAMLLRPCTKHLTKFNAQHFSNMVWSLSVMRPCAWDKSSLWQFIEASRVHIPLMTPQGLSNIIWGCTKLHVCPSQSWMHDFYAHSQSRICTWSGQAVANTLWALATMHHQPPSAWMYSVYAQTQAHLSSYDAQALSNAIWALPTLIKGSRAYPSKAWLCFVYTAAEQQLSHMSGQELSALLSGISKLMGMSSKGQSSGQCSPGMEVVKEETMNIPRGSSGTSTTGQALTIAPLSPPASFLAAAAAALRRLTPSLNEQSFCSASKCLAKLGYMPEDLEWLSDWAAAAVGHLSAGSSMGISSCLFTIFTWKAAGYQIPTSVDLPVIIALLKSRASDDNDGSERMALLLALGALTLTSPVSRHMTPNAKFDAAMGGMSVLLSRSIQQSALSLPTVFDDARYLRANSSSFAEPSGTKSCFKSSRILQHMDHLNPVLETTSSSFATTISVGLPFNGLKGLAHHPVQDMHRSTLLLQDNIVRRGFVEDTYASRHKNKPGTQSACPSSLSQSPCSILKEQADRAEATFFICQTLLSHMRKHLYLYSSQQLATGLYLLAKAATFSPMLASSLSEECCWLEVVVVPVLDLRLQELTDKEQAMYLWSKLRLRLPVLAGMERELDLRFEDRSNSRAAPQTSSVYPHDPSILVSDRCTNTVQPVKSCLTREFELPGGVAFPSVSAPPSSHASAYTRGPYSLASSLLVLGTLKVLPGSSCQPSVRLLQHLMGHLYRLCLSLNGRSLCICLWSCARLGYRPSPQRSNHMWFAMRRRHRDMTGSELALSLWSLASMRCRPDQSNWAAMISRLRTLSTELEAVDCCRLLHAASVWGMDVTSKMWEGMLSHGLSASSLQLEPSCRQLIFALRHVNLLGLTGFLSSKNSQSWQHDIMQHLAKTGLRAVASSHLLVLIEAMALSHMLILQQKRAATRWREDEAESDISSRGIPGISEEPAPSPMSLFKAALIEVEARGVTQMKNHTEYAWFLRCLVLHRHQTQWIDQQQLDNVLTIFFITTINKLESASTQQLLHILYWLGHLNSPPHLDWLGKCSELLLSRSRGMPSDGLSCCLLALLRCGLRPSPLWVGQYMGVLLKNLSHMQPRHVCHVTAALSILDARLHARWSAQLEVSYG
ncbi:hypothetical protein CEUSTIGMA_g12528.t1 [Chlamydomonas eustigma]|uniref:Uncharacterized protein n=1 Tax=Chlamydomonas eustigma TaxID=1157962 RepID=A0A250XPX1_9CHLO|nr:hypothetical protein CEUSTIGMA_g12528.t1 [Chlamydomonas eustigma]|eukprot:GAX85108.1 hypothetical protein CEUSTIGMA_g12528.t1 [Chlamydomonas eustigma]